MVLFSPRESPIPRCRKHWRTCGRTADGRTDVRMWLYDTLDRSRRTRRRAGGEEDGMEEKVLFRPLARPRRSVKLWKPEEIER